MRSKITYIILIVILIAIFYYKSRPNSLSLNFDNDRSIATVIVGTENRQNLIRGWNDLTLLVIEKKDTVDIISFPRDTLVNIPKKGKWTINSLYLVLGKQGMIEWFNNNFPDISVEYLIEYDIKSMRILYETLSGSVSVIPNEYKDIFNDFQYTQSWIRHRRLLYNEYYRQQRIQAYMSKCSDLIKKDLLNSIQAKGLSDLVEFAANKHNFDTNYSLELLYYSIRDKEVRYRMAPGYFCKAKFKLTMSNGRTFLDTTKYVYNLTTYSHDDIINTPYNNPFVFSKDDFLKGANKKYKVKVNEELIVMATNWNGGLISKYSRKYK